LDTKRDSRSDITRINYLSECYYRYPVGFRSKQALSRLLPVLSYTMLSLESQIPIDKCTCRQFSWHGSYY
ncbi:hypothetical protein J6590_083714, partial [Homalodisca vitripennis]